MSFFKKKPETLAKNTLERIKICKNKKSTLARQSRNDAAQLLQKAQYEKAMARVELVCKEENMVITYELLADYCQLFLKRVDKLRSGKECPEDLKRVIATILYVAPRCGDLPELQEIRSYLRSIYGDEFCNTAANIESQSNLVDQKIIGGLSTQPPNQETKISVLKAIATEHQIPWNPAIETVGVKSITKTKSTSSDSNLSPKDTPPPASDHRGHELAREGSSKDNHFNAKGQVKAIASDKAKEVEERSTVREFEASERTPSVKPSAGMESSIAAKGGIMEHKKPIGVKKDDRYREGDQLASNGAANKYPQRDDCNNDKSSIRYSKLSSEHHDGDKEMLNRRGSGQLAGKGATNSPKREDHHNNISSTRYNQLSCDHQDGNKGMLNRRGSDQLPINDATNSRQRDDRHDNIPSARSDKLSTDHIRIDGEKEMLSRRDSGQSSDKINTDRHFDGEKEMLSRRASGQSRQRSLRLKREKELADQLKAAAEEAFRSAAEAEEAAGVAEAAVIRASPRTRASVKGYSHQPNSNAIPRLDTENVVHRKSEGRSSQAESHVVDHAAAPKHEYYPQLVPKAMESSHSPIQIDEEREKTRFHRNSRVNPSGDRVSAHQDLEEVKHVVYPDDLRGNLSKFHEAKEEETILLSKPKPRSFDNNPHTKNKVEKYGEPPAQNNIAPRFDDSDGDKDNVDEEEWRHRPKLYYGSGKGANLEKHVGHDLPKYDDQHISSDKPLRPHWVPKPHTSYDDLNEFEPADHIEAAHISTQYGITGRSSGMPFINEAYNRQSGMMKGGGRIKNSPDSGTMEDRAQGRYAQPRRKPGGSKHDLGFDDDDDDDEHTSKSGSNDSNIGKPAKYTSVKWPTDSKYGQFVDAEAQMYRQKDTSQPWEIEHDKPPYGRRHPPVHTANEIDQYIEIFKDEEEEEEEEEEDFYTRRRGSAGYAKKVTRAASIDEDDDGYDHSSHWHRGGYQSTHRKMSAKEHVPSRPQRSVAYGSAEEGRSKQNAEWDTRNAMRISSAKPKQLGTIGMRQLKWNSTRNNIPSDDGDDAGEDDYGIEPDTKGSVRSNSSTMYKPQDRQYS